MKLVCTDRAGFHFELSAREKRLLFDLLKLYPLVPAAHQRLSRATQAPAHDENQRLLDDALAAQRRENRQRVLALLNEPGHFQQTASGHRFTVSAPETDWLLQVLNDIRVGSWIALGSPDTEKAEQVQIDGQTMPHLWALELAGFFESALLEALGVD